MYIHSTTMILVVMILVVRFVIINYFIFRSEHMIIVVPVVEDIKEHSVRPINELSI